MRKIPSGKTQMNAMKLMLKDLGLLFFRVGRKLLPRVNVLGSYSTCKEICGYVGSNGFHTLKLETGAGQSRYGEKG